MRATITGLDSLSLRILADLARGVRVSELPDTYPVSLDQAKRLSRYYKILKLTEKHLDSEFYTKVQAIGLKVLPLAKLFRSEDWEGLTEILSIVTDDTKRDDLELMIEGLEEKRLRIQSFKEESSYTIELLQDTERSLKKEEGRLVNLLEELEKTINYIVNSYDNSTQKFLLEHLGLYKGTYVLVKRLDSLWQQSLEKQSVIMYDPSLEIFYIKDLHELALLYMQRIIQGKKCLWEYSVDIEVLNTNEASVPINGQYDSPEELVLNFLAEKSKLRKDLKKLRANRSRVVKEISKIKKLTLLTYMESVDRKDILSIEELKKKEELQGLVMSWLYSRGYVTVNQFVLPNNYCCDVFAYNESGHIIIIKILASLSIRYEERFDHLDYCDEFYIFVPDMLSEGLSTEYSGFGQLVEIDNRIILKQEDLSTHSLEIERQQLLFSASRLLAKRNI